MQMAIRSSVQGKRCWSILCRNLKHRCQRRKEQTEWTHRMDKGLKLRKTHFKEPMCNTSPISMRHSQATHHGHSIWESSCSGKETLWSAGPRCSFLIIWTSKLLGNYFTPIKACSYSLKNSSSQSPFHPMSKCSEAARSRQRHHGPHCSSEILLHGEF